MAFVHEKVPLSIRCLTILFALIAFATASAGHLRACTFGTTHYNSHHQVNFVIFVGVLVFTTMVARVIVFDIKKRALPGPKLQLAFDVFFALITFIAAISGALSPVANDVCTGDNDMKIFIEETCEFSCGKIVWSIIMTFATFTCFLGSMIFTLKLVSAGANDAADDFSFGEQAATPRARKINQQTQARTLGQV